MSQAFETDQPTVETQHGEFKEFAANDSSCTPSLTSHTSDPLLSRNLFTQDRSKLHEYSEVVANNSSLCQNLVDIVLASRIIHEDPERDRAVTTAASNAISILNYGSRSGLFSFRFVDVRDWSGIRVPGANLNYAVMAHCNLDDADLSNSTMINITLFKASLNRTNLTGVKNYESTVLSVQPDPGTSEGPYNLTVHPNGALAASGMPDGMIRIFNIETNEDICQLSGHTAWIRFLSFSRDGHYLASVAADNFVRIWDLTTYQCKSLFTPPPSVILLLSPITFSPDSTNIVVVCTGFISVGNIETSEWTTTFEHDNVIAVDWSSRSNYVLSYTQSGDMCIWDIAISSCTAQWHISGIRSCRAKFTLDGTKVVASAERALYLFDAGTGECVSKLPKQPPNNSVFTIDRSYLYATSRRWICVFDLETHQCIAKFLDKPDVSTFFPSTDGRKLFAYCQGNCMLRVFDTTLLTSPVPSLTGDGQSYFSLAFSPDNRYLVAANRGSDGNLKFLDTTTGHCAKAASVLGYKSETYLLSCCPNGRFIAFVTHLNHEIFIYDVSKPTGVTKLNKHVSCVVCITFNSQGNLLASSAMNSDDHEHANGNILLWDTATWKSRVLRGHTQPVHAMCFSPDGDVLASASDDQLRIWNVVTDKCIKVIRDRLTSYHTLSYSPCGRFLAEYDRGIRIWDALSWDCFNVFEGQPVSGDISFLRNGHLLSSNGTYCILDIFTGENVDLGVKVTDARLVLSQDSRLMATKVSVDTDNAVYLWQFPDNSWKSKIILEYVDTGKVLANLQATTVNAEQSGIAIVSACDSERFISLVTSTPIESISSLLQGHASPITCLHTHGPYLVSGSHDSTVRLWNLETKQCTAVLEAHDCGITSVQLSHDARLIASGSQDTTIRLWSISEAKYIGQFEGHTTPVKLIRFSPDGSLLASVESGSNVVHIWDIGTGSYSMILDQHADEIFDIQFSADGSYLGSASHDNSICVWEMKTGECVATLKGHTDSLTCFVITSDGKTVVSGSEDTTIRIWDVMTGECKLIIKGHTGHIRSLCLTPDDRCIISASNDRVIQIWDITTGAILHQLLGHTDAVISAKLIQYDAQGESMIVSGSLDGTLRVWMVDKMSSRNAYLPEIYGMVGAQEIIDLSGANMSGAVMDDYFARFVKSYHIDSK